MSARSIRRTHEREASRSLRRRGRKTAVAAATAASAAALFAPSAEAANFTVTNLSDAGAGSLRSAIASANGSAGADSIGFVGAATSGEIRLTTGEIAITDGLTITGPGTGLSVSGDADNDNVRDFATSNVAPGDSRIFNISDASTPGSPLQNVSITGITLREGVADEFTGGNAYNRDGGAIYAQQTALNLVNVNLSDNVSTRDGGAVYLTTNGAGSQVGRLSIANSTLTNNRTLSSGGAVASRTQKYDPSDNIDGTTISNSQLSGNTAGGTNFGAFGYNDDPQGGAVSTKYGSGAITGSTVTGNIALTNDAGNIGGEAGGLAMLGGGRVTSSVISGNTAGNAGGGASVSGAKLQATTVSGNTVLEGSAGGLSASPSKYGSSGPTRIDDSTITGNSAGGTGTYEGRGGGVAAYGYGGGPAVVIRNSTIAANAVTNRAGGVFAYTDGGDYATVELKSTIVADNTAAGGGSDTVGGRFDGTDPVDDPSAFSAGFSLIESPTTSVIGGDPAGSNLIGIDPKLSPLADNGGPTPTQALALNSPAIDSAQANGFSTDGRGAARTVDSVATNAPLSDGTDIGSFEVQDGAAVGGDPDTAFAKKPPKKLKLKGKKPAKVKIAFTGTDNSGAPGPLTFECRVDKGKFDDCTTPLKLKLAKGKHTIAVRAIDSDGRVDSSPAEATIKVKKKKKPKKK